MVGRIGGIGHACEGRTACRHGDVGDLRRGGYGYGCHRGAIRVSGAAEAAMRRDRGVRGALQAKYTTLHILKRQLRVQERAIIGRKQVGIVSNGKKEIARGGPLRNRRIEARMS